MGQSPMDARIAVIGLGTTGTALGLALRQAGLEGVEVAGHDREPEAAKAAHRAGAVDVVELNLLSCVAGAHLVVICTPSAQTVEVIGHISSGLTEGSVVTDTVGTKAAVVARAKQCLPSSVSFVAGHLIPARNAEHAAAHSFRGGTHCIIADSTTPREAVRDVLNLATLLGTQPYFMGLEEHDAYTVAAELLPVVVSTALLEALRGGPGWTEISKMAGHRFRAATESVLATPGTSRDEMTANAALLARWLDSLTQSLDAVRQTIQEGTDEELLSHLAEAHVAREKWQLAGPDEEEGPDVMDPASGLRQFFLGGLFRGGQR